MGAYEYDQILELGRQLAKQAEKIAELQQKVDALERQRFATIPLTSAAQAAGTYNMDQMANLVSLRIQEEILGRVRQEMERRPVPRLSRETQEDLADRVYDSLDWDEVQIKLADRLAKPALKALDMSSLIRELADPIWRALDLDDLGTKIAEHLSTPDVMKNLDVNSLMEMVAEKVWQDMDTTEIANAVGDALVNRLELKSKR